MSRLGLFVAVCGLVLAGCRLDADVRMTMNPDGSGEVVLAVTVDADVVAQVPGLAGGLQFADAVAAGWTVEGPTSTESGGLAMTLRHSFATAEEATNLLRSIGPPINPDVTITRTATSDEVAVTVAGTASLAGGSFDAYADANLVQAAGGVPFGPALAAAGATPATSMGVVLTLDLPGEITATTGSERDGAVVWELPLDGSTTDLATSARLREGGGGGWDAVGTIALVLMIAWLLAGIALAVLVVRAGRRRRRSRYIGNRYR